MTSIGDSTVTSRRWRLPAGPTRLSSSGRSCSTRTPRWRSRLSCAIWMDKHHASSSSLRNGSTTGPGLAAVVDPFPYLRRRLAEWALLRRLAASQPGSPDELVTASDWCQRTAANTALPPDALLVLAERGRTRRIRAAARDRLASLPQHP